MTAKAEILFWKEQGLSVRASNALGRRKLASWHALALHTLVEIGRFPGIGKRVLREIEVAAAGAGFILREGDLPTGSAEPDKTEVPRVPKPR
jgi:DNA-directed RNA polymerase alpha subunit